MDACAHGDNWVLINEAEFANALANKNLIPDYRRDAYSDVVMYYLKHYKTHFATHYDGVQENNEIYINPEFLGKHRG